MKNSYRISVFFLLVILSWQTGFTQKPEKWNSSDIYRAIKKLNVLGSVLYVAAHPDDENTRMISHLSSGLGINTAYLSLTRGDGGQNLIGTEIEEFLGVIRTQELLAARRIDGGHQLFTRANDFGFSKHPDETLRIWNKDEVLADVVWAIRKWQPDVIINRFDHNSAGKTHGHHTASGMLGVEAFDLAANPKAYPEQLKYVNTWQPRRLFFNTSWWFYGSQEKFDAADKSKMLTVDAGKYYPLIGKSNNEIAAESRSMHKSQGFGSVGNRGESLEYLDLLKGDFPKNSNDPGFTGMSMFEGIDVTWSRVKGGAPIGDLLKRVEMEFRQGDPAASVPLLMQAYSMMVRLPDGYWKREKMEEIEKVISACMGLFVEAVANDFSATPGQEVELTIEAINRSGVPCVLQAVRYVPANADSTLNLTLGNNKGFTWKKKLILPAGLPYTNSYWLNDNWESGMYTVRDQQLRGVPETPRNFKVQFSFLIDNQPFMLEREIIYKKDDDVKGEVYRPFEVTPPVFVNFPKEVFIFTNHAPRPVEVVVKSGAPNISGKLTLARPQGWRIQPEFIDFSLKLKGEEQTVTFQLYPPEEYTEGKISPIATVGDAAYTESLVVLEYDHIPVQTLLLNAEAKIAKIDLKKAGDKVAYIMGAGDKVPESLRETGYRVDLLEDGDITPENLKNYDAVVLGVRAYNTVERLKFHQPKLLEYVKKGGTLIVQYNTNFSMTVPAEEIAPYKLKISRDRVTVEDAEMRFLLPSSEVLNFPNKITAKDFEGWVQERGLYFPSEWGPEFQAVLSCNDPGEPARDGSLLVADYGEGHYVYTGLSFFRELPSGVSGAYRLFANLISLGQHDER
jgi:LmbE family N-acetylglucosaminyl deacetylase